MEKRHVLVDNVPNSRLRKTHSLNDGASTKGKYSPECTVQ